MITFDLETTNSSKGSALDLSNRCLMICWQVDDGPVYSFEGGILDCPQFIDDLMVDGTAICHNAKFEMHWLKRAGIDIDKIQWHDTMLAERVIAGNRSWKLGLGDVAGRYGEDTKDPVIDSMMKAGVCPSDMPQRRLKARCIRDVRVTRKVYKRQIERLTEDNLLHIYRTRCNFAAVLCHMESHGMLLDKERVLTAYEDAAKELAAVKQELDRITGGINLRSPDQLAHYLYGTLGFPEKRAGKRFLRNKPSKQFPDGRPKTDQHTMQWLSKQAKTKEQKKFIELKQLFGKLNADVTKNLEFFKGIVEERDECFMAQFNQIVAGTHRLSSSGVPVQFRQFAKPKSVQLQNSPRKFKRLYRAPELDDGHTWYVVETDAAQLEFRVAAFCGDDEQARRDIADPNFDAHCTSAAVMNDIAYETFLRGYRGETTKEAAKSTKRLRQEAKADTFKPLFGGTRGTPEQEKWYKEFQNRYSHLYSEQEAWVADVATNGVLVTDWGMRFYWSASYNRRGMLIDNKTKRPIGPQVFNYPIQSLATAEMMPIAITLLYKMCKESGLTVKLVNTIHDSVIAYVRDDELDRYRELCNKAFTSELRDYLNMFYGIDFNVPLGCGFTPGRHWGEGDEQLYDEVES